MYEGCSLTIGTRRRHCPFGVQPVFCMVSDQHRRVLYPTLFDIRAGVFYVLGDDSPNTQDQRLYVVSEPREIHSLPMLRARFLHLTNFTALVEVRTTNRRTAGQRVTAQPHSSRVYFERRVTTIIVYRQVLGPKLLC